MPDRRKKKTREDAVRMLQQRAANSGIKNEAQQKAWESGFKGSRSNADTKTATTPQTSRTTQSTNSSTTPRNSLQTSQRGSQSPSVSRRSPSLTDVANRRNLVTSERAKRTQLTTPTRRTSSINNIDDRRSGRYRNDRREQQSYVNTPRNRVQYDKGKTTIGDRVADTLKGSAKQWAGGHMSSVGTAAQFAEPTVRGIQKTEYRDPSETGYSLRSRKEAELRQNERTQNIGVKEGRDLRTFKGRDYSDKNANLQAFIKSADSLIDSGSRDIERAKKGAGKLGSFAIDTMSNMAQMGGDLAANVALPGLGMVALGMRSAGMGSYQARQQGLDVNEQALHGLIDGVVEMGSEAIFGGVSALQKTYGKGMFSLADKLGWRTASSEMVRRMFKTDFGQALATHLSRLGAGMLEEGTEELIADVFEPALKYVFTKANNPDYKFEGTDLKQMGYDFLLGAMTAGVLGGGSTVAGVRADSQAFVDGQNYAQDLVNRARVQGREGMATTNAEILGGRLQSQMERGIEASPYQIRTLQEAVGESQLANAIDYEKRNAERYQQAVDEGRADTVKQQGTYQEYEGYRRRVDDTLERNYERARSVMGEDASEESVNAVRNVITGSTDNYDIDTVLTDNEAKKAVETLTGTKLSVNNQTARNEIENIALTRQIQNRDAILQETHESIRTEMSKRGGQLFDENYDRAVETLDVPNGANIYDSFFSRFYTDGTVQGADFDKSYNRIMGSIREDFGDELAGKIGEVFNMDFAQKVFAEGQMAQAAYNAKYQGKALSLKASENPAGFTYEDTARAKISDRQADLLTKFAERANIHIRLVDSIAGGSANGSYENGVIMIAADSTNKLVTVAKHELTHHIRSTSPELYQKLEDFIFNKYYEYDADALENKIREYQERGYNMTAEKIKEEIVADASEAFFTDEGSIQAVVKHDRGLAQAIHDGIKTLLDTLLDLQDSDNLGTRGYGDFLDDIDILREAEKMWLDALNDSVQKTRDASTSTETASETDTETKHSLKEQDQAYMDAVNRGDMETAQKMVDEAAKKAGYTVKAYHGTTRFGFTKFSTRDANGNEIGESNGTVFGDGFYFTDSIDVARERYANGISRGRFVNGEYVTEKANNGVYNVYLNLGNNYEIDMKNVAGMPRNDFNRLLRNAWKDHNSLTLKNIKDGVDIESTVYVIEKVPENAERYWDTAWSSSRIKSADPVVYDDQGNVIPLSERFNQENEDIRYSIKEDEETTNPNVNVLDKSGKVLTTSKGDPVAKFEKNGSAQFSLKTYEDKGRGVLKNYLKKMVKAGDFSQAEADQMYNEMETIYRITRDLADTGKYAPFTAWSEADVVMGKNNKPVFSSVKANSEYKMNIDFSTICKKRRTLDAVFRTMINRGMMENLDLNKDESAALVVNINDLIRKYDFEAACALCFVEARRYRQQQTAKTFRDMWNGLVESMYKDKSKIEYFNFGEDKTIKEVPDGIHTMDNKDLDLTYVRQIATARKEDGKLMQTAEAKAAREILNHPSQRKLMRIGDMMASTGFENMQVKNPALMKIYNAKKGTGGAKSSFGDVQYLNEIINSKTFDRKKAYAVSGVRIQSFSDYVPRMVFDYVQVIADLAAKRLPAHAYTKEVLFVLQFGLTGAKINMSLVPDVVKDGIAPGLDKDGNYVWNTDGTFPWEDYKDDKGRTWPGARSIQKAKGYKENCGTIAVGISDEQIWKMLADPEIQMVIPYHKSSLNPLVAQMTNVDRFTDYTDYQNTKTRDGKNVPKEFDWDNKLFELSHGKDGKLLPKSEWGDIQDLVQEYVDWCNENDYVPKFERFLYMKDGSINPGYYKMLEDFALLDEEGNFKPQDDVKMRFPTKDSAYGDMASLIEQGLSEDTTLERKRDSKVGDIVDEIGELLKTEEGRQALTQKSMESDILSARMENEDEDVRYQIKEDSSQTIASQNTIAKLEQNVKDLKAEFKRTDLKTADPKQARIQAGKLIQRHGSNMGVQKDLTDTFNQIFRLYKEKGTDAFDEVYEIAKDAAVNVVNNISEVRSEGREEYDAIKQYLRETPITISEDMKRNITDYNEFRKRNFGKLKLKNGETSNIDNVYMELMEMFPEQFTDDYVNPHDQLNHIIDVLDNFAPYYETLDGASEEMQDYVVDIAADIMETAYNLQTKKTFADKKYEEKVRAVEKARQKALESRNKALERQKTRYEKQADALKEELWKANERTAAAKLRGEMDIQRLKQQQAESKEKARERRAESRERTKLLNIARRLDKLKTTAENRAQIDALIGDLDLVAKGMTDKSLDKLYELAQWYDDRSKNDPDFIPDSNIENKLKRLSKTHIKDMTIEEVRDLYDVLSNIENEIATEKKLIDSEVKKEIYEAGRETIRDINRSHGIAKSLRKLDTFFISGTLSPLRQIRRVTGYNDNDPLYIATKELADGQRKMLQYQMDSWKAFDKFMNDKKFINSLNGKSAEEIEVTGYKDGEPYSVKITPDIRMAMYLAGMNEDNLRHMKYGGITLPDIKLYKKGKISEAMEAGETVKFSPSQIREITSHMSEREKEFAQEAYKYYNITSPQAINEVSEVLKGYSLARVDNYFPIHTDSDYLTKEFESMKFDGTIEGMGFLKERVKASNPILMTGLVDTLTKSIEMNSKYVGLAIPVRNFSKIYGVKDMTWDEEGNAEFNGSVKRSISKKWGKSVASYIEKFMTDLQNGRKSTDEWGSVFSRARSRYAGAVLTLNASVAIKQAASYPTAAAVLGWAPLAKAMGNVGKVDLDLIAKYTPLQWYRSKGFSTTELGDITSSRTGNIPTPLNWIQGMDVLTTRKLWKASEYYVRQHNKNLKTGTDEYYKAVADIYNRVIEETQPNYTTMQRPGLLRSDNEITLTLNMFKTQPYQNFNILFDAFGNFVAKRNQYKSSKSIESKKALKEANRDMQNAVTSQIAQLAVFAAMTSLWALFRRKDDKYKDEEGKLTIFSYMKKLGEDMISNLFADVPLGADIYSMASSVFTGDTYYGFTSVTDSAITDVMDSFKNGAVAVGDWIEYGRSDNPEKKPSSDMYKETENVISSASRAMGIPASNLRNLVNGIYGWVAVSADGEYIGTYEAQKMTFAKEKEMKQNLFRAYQNDKTAYEELRKMMIEDGFEEEKLDDYITWQRREHHTEEEQNAIDSTMKKLESSNIWKDATEDEKKDFTNRVTNLALGITNTDTESITKYAVNGLTNEQVILYKLALKKADRQNDNNKSYNNDEKEAALKMLERNYKLTQAQKDALKGKKS